MTHEQILDIVKNSVKNGAVITSYRIHYTKLYDGPGDADLEQIRRGDATVIDTLVKGALGVITSYSIHYTKLYECGEGSGSPRRGT